MTANYELQVTVTDSEMYVSMYDEDGDLVVLQRFDYVDIDLRDTRAKHKPWWKWW